MPFQKGAGFIVALVAIHADTALTYRGNKLFNRTPGTKVWLNDRKIDLWLFGLLFFLVLLLFLILVLVLLAFFVSHFISPM